MEKSDLQKMTNNALVKLIGEFAITKEEADENNLNKIQAIAQILQGVEYEGVCYKFYLEGNKHVEGRKPYSYDLRFEIEDLLKFGKIEKPAQNDKIDLIDELKKLDIDTLQLISTTYYLRDHGQNINYLKNGVERVTGENFDKINEAYKKYEEIEQKRESFSFAV